MPITSCPTCGSRKIKRRKTDVTFKVKGRRKVVKNLELEVCPACGEKLFDPEASRQVEEAFGIHYPRRQREAA